MNLTTPVPSSGPSAIKFEMWLPLLGSSGNPYTHTSVLPWLNRAPDVVTDWQTNDKFQVTLQPFSLTSSRVGPAYRSTQLIETDHSQDEKCFGAPLAYGISRNLHLCLYGTEDNEEISVFLLWNLSWKARWSFKLDYLPLVEPEPAGAEDAWNCWSEEAGLY